MCRPPPETTLGPRRSLPRACHHRDRRPDPVFPRDPPSRSRIPAREHIRHLGPDPLIDRERLPGTHYAPSNGSAEPRTSRCAARPAPANRCSWSPSAKPRSTLADGSPCSVWNLSESSSAVTAPKTASPKPSPGVPEPTFGGRVPLRVRRCHLRQSQSARPGDLPGGGGRHRRAS